jgi:sialic acid synthase SpsE/mannose-6-phosphate isomerase-like protein (cupin superfamily)
MSNNKILIIFEMANNHMGDIDHAYNMINEYSKILNSFKDTFDFAWKFQFRNLDTFIHPKYKNNLEHKYVKRFLETNLSKSDFIQLKNMAQSNGFITMCTAFDEISVDNIFDMNFDIIKVASCSFTDWPLLYKIIETNATHNKKVILSTAGSSLTDIDSVVSFMVHRNQNITLMHCVGEYPTDHDRLQLNQIDLLKNRYTNIPIGYSTHEDPNETDAAMIAVGKGVSAIEKHVALYNSKYNINAYSLTPEQMSQWLDKTKKAIEICGISGQRHSISEKEKSDLLQFKRGVFVKNNQATNSIISKSNVFFAWPSETNQLLANDMSKYNNIVCLKDIPVNEPVLKSDISIVHTREKIWNIVQKIKAFISDSKIIYSGKADLEISHHYGIDEFDKTGLTMITVVNREYCKKLLILLPNQNHPEQYHRHKEETFIVLYGDVILSLNGVEETLHTGDKATIEPGVKHSFHTHDGCIIEEISTRHDSADSYYIDESINTNPNRKTLVTYWL